MIIGIVGKVGSGKSACVKYIVEKYGAISFSCDQIAKEMMESGEIDYKVESPGLFFTNENLQEYCRINVHKPVFERIKEYISEENKKGTKILLIETALPNDDFIKSCDKVIYIDNTYGKKLELLKEHRGYTDNQVKMIYDSQKYYEKFYDMADYVIENNATKDEFLNKVKEVMDEICIICKQ